MTLEELSRLLDMCKERGVSALEFGNVKVSFYKELQPPAGPTRIIRQVPPSDRVSVDLQAIQELENRLMSPVQGSATNDQ